MGSRAYTRENLNAPRHRQQSVPFLQQCCHVGIQARFASQELRFSVAVLLVLAQALK